MYRCHAGAAKGVFGGDEGPPPVGEAWSNQSFGAGDFLELRH